MIQEMLGATPRAFAAFATHLHLLVSESPIVHQRMVLPQVLIFSTSISLPFKYVAIVIFVKSTPLLSSCIIRLKLFVQSEFGLCSQFDNFSLRNFATSLKKANQDTSKRVISKRDLE